MFELNLLLVRRILTDSDGARTLSNTSLMAGVSWVLLSAGVPSRVSGMLYIIKPWVSFFIFTCAFLESGCVSAPEL